MERQIFLAVILGFLFTLHAGVQEVHAQTENQVMNPPGTYSLPYIIPEITFLYPFGATTDHLMPRFTAFTKLPLSRPFPFFDTLYRDIYPNTFGSVTFGAGTAVIPEGVPTLSQFRLIGPYWAHTELQSCTQEGASDGRSRGDVFVRETEEPSILARITQEIRSLIPSESRYTAQWAFIMTNYEVRMPGWNCEAPHTTFQLVLSTNGVKSFALFLYHRMGPSSNTCGHIPYGGIDAGDGVRYLVLPESGTWGSGNFSETLQADSNVGQPGKWVYRVDGEEIVNYGCSAAGSQITVSPRFGPLLGGTKLSITGACLPEAPHNVTCRIDGVTVRGVVPQDTLINCITPLGIRLAKVLVEVSTDGGLTYPYNSTYAYEHITTDVVLQNEFDLNSGRSQRMELTWNPESFPVNTTTVVVQMLAWYTTPVLGTHPIERPKEYVSAWKEKDQFSAVIITLAVTENIGSAAIPTSNLLTAATQNLGLYAGSLRVLSQADAENPAEQNGFLQSHALYSTVKQMSFLQHAGTSTPFSNRPPVFVQLGDILAAGYRKYKSKIDCFVGMAQGLAMDAAISMLTGGIGAPAVIYRRARAFCRMFATVKEQWDDIQDEVDLGLEAIMCTAARRALRAREVKRESCPPTKAQAMRDVGRYSADPECREGSRDPSNCIWNVGSTHCVLTPTTSQGVASQCCFSPSGRLLDARSKLVSGGGYLRFLPFNGHGQFTPPTSRGLAEVLDLGKTIFSKVKSVIDWGGSGFCCALAGNKDLCKDLAETIAGSLADNYIPPRPAITVGDPHVATFDGCQYTFNGLGEYVITQVPGIATIQGRTKKTGNGKATVWQAVAIQGATSARLHIQHNAIRGIQMFANDQEIDFNIEPEVMQFEDITTTKDSNSSTVKVVLSSGISLDVTSMGDILDVIVYLPASEKGLSVGLFGSWDDNMANDLKTPGPSSDTYNCSDSPAKLFEFGNKWRVPPAESLFRYAAPDTYNTINDLTYLPDFSAPTLTLAQAGEAQELCGGNQQCLFDFSVTGDKAIAQASVAALAEFAVIQEDVLKVVSCPALALSPNAQVTNEMESTFLENEIVQLVCTLGAVPISGNTVLLCRDDGTWNTTDILECALTCPAFTPTAPAEFAVAASEPFIAGTSVSLGCASGSSPASGQANLTCSQNGTWDGSPLLCGPATTGIPQPGPTVGDSGMSTEKILWIVMSILITALVCLLITTAVLCFKFNQIKQRNKKTTQNSIAMDPRRSR